MVGVGGKGGEVCNGKVYGQNSINFVKSSPFAATADSSWSAQSKLTAAVQEFLSKYHGGYCHFFGELHWFNTATTSRTLLTTGHCLQICNGQILPFHEKHCREDKMHSLKGFYLKNRLNFGVFLILSSLQKHLIIELMNKNKKSLIKSQCQPCVDAWTKAKLPLSILIMIYKLMTRWQE